MIGKYLIFIGFSKADGLTFTSIKDHIFVMEPVLQYFKPFFHIFLNLVEISAISISQVVKKLKVTLIKILKRSGPSIEPFGTSL